MQDPKSERGPIAPYLSYKTFRNFVDSLKVAMPGRIDRSLMKSMSGANQNYLMAALQYFRLIDQTGVPTQRLADLAASAGPERQKILRDILASGYPFLFNGFDLHRATSAQLDEQFRKNVGGQGDTTRKGLAFFLAAAKDADVPLSHFIKQRGPGRPSGTRTRRQPAVGAAGGTGKRPQREAPPGPPSGSWSAMLLAKFPEFDPAWTDDVKAKWFQAFERLMNAAPIPPEEPDVEKDEDDLEEEDE